jgi:hypothetical protein
MAARLTASGYELDQRQEAFGRFRDSSADIDRTMALRERLESDGYLFFRNVIDKRVLSEVREVFVSELAGMDVLATDVPSSSGLRARPGANLYAVMSAINQHPSVQNVAGLPHLLELTSRLLDTPVRVFDYVWPRVAGPGRGSPPHCDRVYMSRGAKELLSVWIPIVDVPIRHGPLMILEGSHRENAHTKRYLELDADNLGILGGLRFKHGRPVHGGKYSARPDKVREEFSSRWLTEDFNAGDVVIFGMNCLHATLDNSTPDYRLSLDIRFQAADEPVDPRFSGEDPRAHSGRDKSIVNLYRGLKQLLSR